MKIKSFLFENRLKVTPLVSDVVEYDENDDIIVRIAGMKSSDVGGAVRVYFDANGKEVMTGRRFDPLSGVMLLRPGVVYRVYTNLELAISLPEDVCAKIVPTEEARDVFAILDGKISDGFEGQLVFTVMPYRRVELEKFVSIARLVFRSENNLYLEGVEVPGTVESTVYRDESGFIDEEFDTPLDPPISESSDEPKMGDSNRAEKPPVSKKNTPAPGKKAVKPSGGSKRASNKK